MNPDCDCDPCDPCNVCGRDDDCDDDWPCDICGDCPCDDPGCVALLDDDEWRSADDRRATRGTSECDGLCDPVCDWCLVAHACPDDCGGGDACPYVGLCR